MTELDLILAVVSFGFTLMFTIQFYMIKTFIRHKEESNKWKAKHSVDIAKLEQKIEDIR